MFLVKCSSLFFFFFEYSQYKENFHIYKYIKGISPKKSIFMIDFLQNDKFIIQQVAHRHC